MQLSGHILFLSLLLYTSCASPTNEGFRSKELISSRGEHLYINSINYGMTSDHQMTVITKDKELLKFEIDTIGVVFGLDPFLYSFNHDTLTLFFNQSNNYKIKDTFSTIKIDYKIVSNSKFMDLMKAAIAEKKLYRVPDLEENATHYIPKPPTD